MFPTCWRKFLRTLWTRERTIRKEAALRHLPRTHKLRPTPTLDVAIILDKTLRLITKRRIAIGTRLCPLLVLTRLLARGANLKVPKRLCLPRASTYLALERPHTRSVHQRRTKVKNYFTTPIKKKTPEKWLSGVFFLKPHYFKGLQPYQKR